MASANKQGGGLNPTLIPTRRRCLSRCQKCSSQCVEAHLGRGTCQLLLACVLWHFAVAARQPTMTPTAALSRTPISVCKYRWNCAHQQTQQEKPLSWRLPPERNARLDAAVAPLGLARNSPQRNVSCARIASSAATAMRGSPATRKPKNASQKTPRLQQSALGKLAGSALLLGARLGHARLAMFTLLRLVLRYSCWQAHATTHSSVATSCVILVHLPDSLHENCGIFYVCSLIHVFLCACSGGLWV